MTTEAPAAARGTLATAFYLAVVILAWGSNYALVKLALRDAAPFTFNALRFSGATIVVAIAVSSLREPLLPVRSERVRLGLIGLCQVTIMLGLSSLGLQWIEASRAVLLAYTMPLWAMPVGWFLLGERLNGQRLLGAMIGFLGLCLLFNPLAMDWTDRDALIGSLLTILATIGWALGATLYRKGRWQSRFWSQIFWQIFIGTLPLIALALVLEAGEPIDATPTLAALTVYNWLIPAAFAYWCWAKVLTRMPVSVAGQLLMLAPIQGVLLGHWLFAEPLRPVLIASGFLILIGAWLTLRRPARHS